LSHGLPKKREGSRRLNEALANVAAEYMDGLTDRQDREATFDRFRAGETRIICNVGVLTIGVDLDVRCIIDAKPTKSKMLFVQTI
jgi:DNA repair protein RadD